MEQILDPASYSNKVSLPLVRAFIHIKHEHQRILIKMYKHNYWLHVSSNE